MNLSLMILMSLISSLSFASDRVSKDQVLLDLNKRIDVKAALEKTKSKGTSGGAACKAYQNSTGLVMGFLKIYESGEHDVLFEYRYECGAYVVSIQGETDKLFAEGNYSRVMTLVSSISLGKKGITSSHSELSEVDLYQRVLADPVTQAVRRQMGIAPNPQTQVISFQDPAIKSKTALLEKNVCQDFRPYPIDVPNRFSVLAECVKTTTVVDALTQKPVGDQFETRTPVLIKGFTDGASVYLSQVIYDYAGE